MSGWTKPRTVEMTGSANARSLRAEVAGAPKEFEAFAQTLRDVKAIDQGRQRAGDMWAEVCWCGLPCLYAGASVTEAIETGIYECMGDEKEA